jgi:hypothetical protein
MDAVVTDVSEQIRLDDGTRLTCMALSHDQSWAAVGDAQGELRKVDLQTGKVFGKFRHIAGSIRDAAFHPSPACNFVAAGGLDRHVRVFDAKKMTCVSTIYAKQKLNCLLFDAQPPVISVSASSSLAPRPLLLVPCSSSLALPDLMHPAAQTAEAEEDEDWLGIQEAKAAKKQKQEEDAGNGVSGEGEGEGAGETEADASGAKALSRKGFNAGKKRKVAPSKKASPAKKKAAAAKKKK